MESLTGKMLLSKLESLSAEELDLPVKIYDSEEACYKDLKEVMVLNQTIILPYVLTSNVKK